MKKLLSLLALVLMSCVGAWAQSYIYKISLLSLDNVTVNTDVPVVMFAYGANGSGIENFVFDNTTNYSNGGGVRQEQLLDGHDRATYVFYLRKAEDGTITLKDGNNQYWAKNTSGSKANVGRTDNIDEAASFTCTIHEDATKKYKLTYTDAENTYKLVRNGGPLSLDPSGDNWAVAQFYTFCATDFALPFKASESVETATWYTVKQTTNVTAYWQVANDEANQLGKVYVSNTTIDPANADQFAFCFVANDDNTFYIYNKKTGKAVYVDNEADHSPVKVSADNKTAVKFRKNGSAYNFYVSDNTSTTIAAWRDADNFIAISAGRADYSGSRPTFTECQTYNVVINGAVEGCLVINGQEYADGSIFVPTISNIATYGSAKQLTGYKGEVTLNGTTITVTYTAGRNVTYVITATDAADNAISWSETKFVPAETTEASVDGLSYDYFSDFTITEDDKTLGNEDVTFHVTATHTLPMVPGKFYHIRYVNGSNQWYMNYEDDTHVQLKAAKNGSSANNLWYVEQASANAPYFSLCSVANLKAVHGTTDGNRVCVEFVDNFAYEFVPSNSNFRIFEAGTNKNLGAHAHYNGSANSGLGMWNTGNHTGGTEYTVEEFEESILNFTNGEEGYVGYCENLSDFTSAKTAFTSEKSAANLKAALGAMANLSRIEIEEGKYYQITFNRGNQALGNYGAYANTEGTVSEDAASRYVTTADYASASTVAGLWQFENDANGKYLKTVQTGFYLANVDNGHLVTTKEKQYGKVFTLKNGNNSATTWQMSENGKTGDNTLNIFYNPGSNSSREIGYYSANDAGDYFTIKEVTEIPLTIKTSKWASMCFPVAVTLPQQLTAYYAVEFSTDGIGLKAVEGKIIPANTPVIVTTSEGLTEAKTYNLTIGGEATAPEGNRFEGSTVPRQGYTNTKYLYGLSNGSFHPINGSSVAANKAYIVSDDNLIPSSSSPLRIYTFDDILTGISTVAASAEQGAYYDLNGRMVAYPTTGVYVRNGKKIFVK